jgi:hypothetical protein
MLMLMMKVKVVKMRVKVRAKRMVRFLVSRGRVVVGNGGNGQYSLHISHFSLHLDCRNQ